MEYGMHRGLVCPFEPKLCQNVATGSRNPLEPLGTPKTTKNLKNQRISDFSPLPRFPPDSPYYPYVGIIPIGPVSGATTVTFAGRCKLSNLVALPCGHGSIVC